MEHAMIATPAVSDHSNEVGRSVAQPSRLRVEGASRPDPFLAARRRRNQQARTPALQATAGNAALFRVQSWLFVVFLLVCVSLSSAAEKLANSDCLDCHTDPTNSRKVEGKSVPMAVFPTNRFDKSVHAKLSCVDCHTGVKDLVHESKLPPPNCSTCHDAKSNHEEAAKGYATSIHGVSHALGASGAANCWDCHGAHDIVPVKQADSPVFKLNLPRTCANCHSNPGLTKEYQMKYPEAASQYMDSIHGRALLKMGLIVAPSCNDCHGVHDIKRAVDRDSPINAANVAKTCGKCHVKIEQTYNQSVHGQLLAKGDKRGPVCTDCHTAHEVAAATRTASLTTAIPITEKQWRWENRTWLPKSRLVTIAMDITMSFRPPIPTPVYPKPTSWPPVSSAIPPRL
jgi:hypothetical protein